MEDGASPLLQSMLTSYPSARQNLIRNLADAMTEHLKAVAPVGKHYDLTGADQGGGTLRDSLFFQVGPGGATLLGAQQGVYVIGGTRPHPIAARHVAMLRFFWAREGVVFTGPRLPRGHPGNRAKDFRLTALARAFGDATIERAADRFWQDMTGGEG